MLKITRRWGAAPGFQVVQVIQYLFFVQLKGAAFKMKCHGSQATAIISQCTLTFPGNFNVAFEL